MQEDPVRRSFLDPLLQELMHRPRTASFAPDLSQALVAGASLLPTSLRDRHAQFLLRSRTPAGGFAGRDGPADLYYTSFALRGLELLGVPPEDFAEGVLRFLGRMAGQTASLSDVVSELEIRRVLSPASGSQTGTNATYTETRRCELLSRVQAHRSASGAYARTPDGLPSTYGTFLGILAHQYLGVPLPDSGQVRSFLLDRQRADGGFAESDEAEVSGTNPTAAAVIALVSVGGLGRGRRRRCARFLAGLEAPEGGLRANPVAPAPDLLSTFTGLVALGTLSAFGEIRLGQTARLTQRLEAGAGGFSGAELDQQADTEYTYYGLGTLAILASVARRRRHGPAAVLGKLLRTATRRRRSGNSND